MQPTAPQGEVLRGPITGHERNWKLIRTIGRKQRKEGRWSSGLRNERFVRPTDLLTCYYPLISTASTSRLVVTNELSSVEMNAREIRRRTGTAAENEGDGGKKAVLYAT